MQRMFVKGRARRAFTLIEILVVIAIIAILAAILFPVFSRARENARRASCMSNLKQIGLAFIQYTQDYDQRYPLSSYPTESVSWTVSAQPYMKSIQLFRCPSDAGSRWDTLPLASPANGDNYYTTSYIINAWIAGESQYSNLAGINSPSVFIVLSEANTDVTQRDHFHPFCWGASPEDCSAGFAATTFDSAKNQTKELAVKRHLDTFNALYADGHVKSVRWSQVWWQDSSHGILEGNFDPRQ
jgi:prepilin-type N-terminal cleavage/methylation domain-containing protein/prepilin-type processing-associated H-X9-DG protein